MRTAFSRLPKIALHACMWLKWFSLLQCFLSGTIGRRATAVPTLLSVGLFFSQIWARSQHAAPSARHRSETSHWPQVQNYGATPEHLDPTQFGQLAGTDSLPDSRCHHPQTWLTFYLQTELTAFLGAVDFNGHFHVFSRSPLGKPRAWRTSCFRQETPEFGGILKSYVTCAAPIFTIIIVKAHLNVAAGIPTP